MMKNNLIEKLLTILLIIGIGFGIYTWLLKPQQQQTPEQTSAQAIKEGPDLTQLQSDGLFNAALQNVSGKTESLDGYRGKTIIVNFWATWCAPCREEMPDLSTVHQQNQNNNIVVLGLAIDEPEPVKSYLEATPVSYPVYVAETQGMTISAELGNQKGVLPYTAIVDPQGNVIKTFYGKVNQNILETALVNAP